MSAKGKLGYQAIHLGFQKADTKRHEKQQATEKRVHDDWVVQEVTYGYKAIKCHHYEK